MHTTIHSSYNSGTAKYDTVAIVYSYITYTYLKIYRSCKPLHTPVQLKKMPVKHATRTALHR